ncbi:MAG: dihydrolipoamide acetyltransferase family protein [Rhodospirillales bacterium]
MTELLLPKLGLTMTEGLLTEWRIGVGEAFTAGQVLFVVETEKVANEIEADRDGALAEILVREGETVPVGTPVARLAGQGAAAPPAALREAADQRIVATPLAKRIAREAGVDLAAVTGSGPRGRIKAEDVREAAASAPVAAPTARSGAPELQEVALTPARLATARRVGQAKREVPHFYLTHEAEVSALSRLREELNAEDGRTRISLTHLLLKALGLALEESPTLNCLWVEDRLLTLPRADVGLLVETGDGLRMPVLRDAGVLALDAIALAAGDLTARARSGQLTGDEVGAAALSLSNVGMFGVSSLTPIVNPPGVMILGVGAERALFRPDAAGAPALRREITLTLACDHRALDGAEAARFLAALVARLEAPLSLLRPARRAA